MATPETKTKIEAEDTRADAYFPQLLEAIEGNDLKKIKELVALGAKLNQKDEEGYSLLHHALAGNKPEIVRYFSEQKNINILLTDNCGNNILEFYLANVENPDLELVKFLLEIKPEELLGNHNIFYQNALIIASQSYSKSSPAIVKMILESYKKCIDADANADLPSIDASNLYNYSALMYLVRKGDLSSVKDLLALGASVKLTDYDGRTVLEVLFSAPLNDDFIEIFSTLIKHGSDINEIKKEDILALFSQLNKDNIKYLQRLIESYPFEKYPSFGKVFREAIQENNKLGIRGVRLCALAEEAKNIKLQEFFIKNGTDPDSPKHDPLAFLNNCCAGNLKEAENLLKKGADINQVNGDGTSALFYAIYTENEPLFNFLIDKPNIHLYHMNPYGFSPLMLARISQNKKLVAALEEKNKKMNSSLSKNEMAEKKAYDRFAQLTFTIKEAGHILGISSEILIKNPAGKEVAIKTEFWESQESIPSLKPIVDRYIAKVLSGKKETKEEKANTNTKNVFEHFSKGLELSKNFLQSDGTVESKKLLEEYEKNQYVILPSGWDIPPHRISITLYKDNIIVCDRGSGVFNGTMVYKVPERKLITEQFIQAITMPNNTMENVFGSLADIGIHLASDGTQLPTKEQSHNTCSFVNIKSAVIGFLFIEKLEACGNKEEAMQYAKQEYKKFTKYMRDDFLERILRVVKLSTDNELKKVCLTLLATMIIEHHGQAKPHKPYDRTQKISHEIERLNKTLKGLATENLQLVLTILLEKASNEQLSSLFEPISMGIEIEPVSLVTESARIRMILDFLKKSVEKRSKEEKNKKEDTAAKEAILPQFIQKKSSEIPTPTSTSTTQPAATPSPPPTTTSPTKK